MNHENSLGPIRTCRSKCASADAAPKVKIQNKNYETYLFNDKLFLQYPLETYGYALLFSLSGYLGIQVVLTLVRTCGALATATVTTARKAVTVALSFLIFTKPFTMQ